MLSKVSYTCMRYSLGNKSFCHHVDIKMTINFSSSWKVSSVSIVLCPYIFPPYQDEVFLMLDRDQDCFGISSYEENEIDLILVIIIWVGFQLQCEQCVYFSAMLFCYRVLAMWGNPCIKNKIAHPTFLK